MIYAILILSLAFLFYVLIPGLGGFRARSMWRRFRDRVLTAAQSPPIRYSDLEHDSREGFVGVYRFIGSLEAIQGTDVVWIRDGNISVSAEFSHVTVYVLPNVAHEDGIPLFEEDVSHLPDEPPQQIPWSRISTLPEGTCMILCGALYSERGHTVFRSEKGRPLTVILFDGSERSVLRRSVWAGRQQNEYWNQLTPISLLTGAIALFVVAYYLSRESALRPMSMLALVAGVGPILPFFPPGIALFFFYRTLWRVGRIRRAERDLVTIPTFRFHESCVNRAECTIPLATGETYGYTTVDDLEQARELAPLSRMRGTSLAKRRTGTGYWVFGVPGSEQGIARYSPPQDPFAEHLILPGNPWDTARSCNRSARVFELAAVLSFAGGFVINAILLLFALVTLVR